MNFAPTFHADAVSSAKIAPRQPAVVGREFSPSALSSASPPMRSTSHREASMSGGKSPQFWGIIDLSGMLEFLRRQHPSKTYDAVAGEIGISAKTVRNWFESGVEPRGRHVLALMLNYGPQFAAACVRGAPTWFDAAARAELVDRLKARRDEADRQLQELMRP